MDAAPPVRRPVSLGRSVCSRYLVPRGARSYPAAFAVPYARFPSVMNRQDRVGIDHLVVAAATLDDGARHVRETLGVDPDPGGRHDRMGTHNRLLRAGPSTYVEVIAVDPDAPRPDRPRWFGLDHPVAEPTLATWVLRVPGLDGVDAFGAVEAMRRGDLNWRLTIPADGAPPFGGALPALIDWQDSPHPCTRLPDRGVVLEALEIAHPEAARLRDLLSMASLSGPWRIVEGEPGLVARFRTPSGPRVLRR